MHICLLLLPSVCKVFHKTKVPQFNLWELWCWRRLLRVPLIARRLNQSILRKINSEYSWKAWCWTWNSCILVIGCEPLTHWKSPWCWERLRAEGEEGIRGWGGWHNEHELGQTLRDDEGQGRLVCCSPWSRKKMDTTGWQNNSSNLIQH